MRTARVLPRRRTGSSRYHSGDGERNGKDAPRDGAFSTSELTCLRALALVMLPDGHAVPGGSRVDVAGAVAQRAGAWTPAVRTRIRWLVRSWELAPLASRHVRPFSRLSAAAQRRWVERAYRSPWAVRRMQVAALRQLVVLVWASLPEVEDRLRYDYRCRRDDAVHGAGRALVGGPSISRLAPEPRDYHRPGPATAGGALPPSLMGRRAHRPQPAADRELRTESHPELSPGAEHGADVVVVGSGAGGAVVAATLAEAGARVIVLEEGAHVQSESDFAGPVFDRFQRFCRDNGTTVALGKPPIPLPLGRVVGGTTVVNSGTCFRAPGRVLERWRREFGVDADEGGLLGHYEDIEDFLNVRPVPWELLGPNGMAAHRGAVALGYSGGPLLRNIADCHGCGQCTFGCPTDAKQAMHISYLPRAQRAGARIFSRCRVDAVEWLDGRALGVTATLLGADDRPAGSLRVRARHVVLCAGAIHTPVLLWRSGVPDPSEQSCRNLRIHPATGVAALFDDDVATWKGTLQSYYIDSFFDSHDLMFEATTTVPGIGAASMPGIGAGMMEQLAELRRIATLGFLVSDTSSGRVWPRRRGEPLISYKLNELDTRRLGIGLAVAAEVLLEAGAGRVFVGMPGLEEVSSRRQLGDLRCGRGVTRSQLRLSSFHPMGTARMGAHPATAVVAPTGEHHAVRRLWVADASTFPSCVGVNPQLTVMAFARRTAQALGARL